LEPVISSSVFSMEFGIFRVHWRRWGASQLGG